MKKFILVLCVFALGLVAHGAKPKVDFFAPDHLASQLPERIIYIGPKAGKDPDADRALQKIRAVRAVELDVDSTGSKSPRPLRQDPPTPPRVNAEAILFVLVSATGEVVATYVAKHTDQKWAQSCSDTVRRWRFEAPKVDGKKVPVLMCVPFLFRRQE